MEVIKYLLYFLTTTLMFLLLSKCYEKIRKSNNKPSRKSLYLIIIGGFLILNNNLYNIHEYRILTAILIDGIIFKLYFRDDFKETIINTIIIVSIYILFEILSTILLLSNANNLKYLNDSMLLKISFTIFVTYITNLFLNINKIKNAIFKIKRIIYEYMSIEFIFLLILLLLNIFAYTISKDFDNIFSIVSTIILLAYVIFSTFSIVKRQYNIKKLEAKNKELTESYKNYTKAFDDFRELKHNLKNDLYSIKAVVPKEKQILLNNLITKYNKKYDWLNDLDNIPEGLEGILYLKQNEAKNNKVNLIINYDSKSKILDKDFLDLCDVLGILLDNAIESSKKTKNKIVMLDVSEDKNFINIKIMNNYNNDININELYKKDYSTKEQKSGLGLYYIDKLKNKNIKVNISVINNLFIVTVKYKKISK